MYLPLCIYRYLVHHILQNYINYVVHPMSRSLPLHYHCKDNILFRHHLQFPYESQSIQLAPNDIVILTTDGLVEATNTMNKMYGFERFEAAIAAGPTDSAQAMLDYLLADWGSFVGQAEPHDDLTIVVIRVSE